MPEWLTASGNIALILSVAANIALWRRDESRQDRVLDAFKEGTDGHNSVASVLESMEHSIGALQRQLAQMERTLSEASQHLRHEAAERKGQKVL